MLTGYFLIHVAIRVIVSPSLDYDESEQVFLSQWLALGYNSQPPLYTWILMAMFQVTGPSVFALALLKNSLLLGTYLLSFGLVRQVTGDKKAAIVAALGLITMPQIGYESHRDLSHTVAVTMTTLGLFYVIVLLAKRQTLAKYITLGAIVGAGLMCKYNFAMTIVATILAAFSVSGFRRCLVDKRLVVSILVAAAIIAPHMIWMATHGDLVSGKTMGQLTSERTHSWIGNVLTGTKALGVTTLGCGGLSIAIFSACFGRTLFRHTKSETKASEFQLDVARLLERFALLIGLLLLLMVLSGHAVAFKNRWLQPFFSLLPAYLTVRLLSVPRIDIKAANRLCWASTVLMVAFSVAIAFRPVTAGYRQKYSWLNIPYATFVQQSQLGNAPNPTLVIAPDMRMAGNMCIQFPHALVLSADHGHLEQHSRKADTQRVLLVTDLDDDEAKATLRQYAKAYLGSGEFEFELAEVPFHHGLPGDQKEFFYHTQNSDRIAQQPRESSSSKPR